MCVYSMGHHLHTFHPGIFSFLSLFNLLMAGAASLCKNQLSGSFCSAPGSLLTDSGEFDIIKISSTQVHFIVTFKHK